MFKQFLITTSAFIGSALGFIWSHTKDHLLFWNASDLYKAGGRESFVTCLYYSMKHRFVPGIIMSAVYVVDFAILYRIGHLHIVWVIVNVFMFYWFIADAYLRGHLDLLYRVVCCELNEDLEKKTEQMKAAKKKAAKKVAKKG